MLLLYENGSPPAQTKIISNFSFYFAPVTNSCSINLNTINDNQESVLDQCKLIKSLDQNYIALRIPYVDKDNFFTFITNTDNAIFSFATMMETMKYLLSSIHKLIQARLVQFDLKGENIVFKKDLSIPIIIDFGISIQIDEVTSDNLSEYFYTYAPDYYIWPIDVHLLCYLASIKNNLQKEDIKKICDVKPASFSPRPKIDSSLLFFSPKKNFYKIKNPQNLEKITRIFFNHRRKMLKKPFNQIFNGDQRILTKLNINLNLRPQNLDFNTYYQLTDEYENLGD